MTMLKKALAAALALAVGFAAVAEGNKDAGKAGDKIDITFMAWYNTTQSEYFIY